MGGLLLLIPLIPFGVAAGLLIAGGLGRLWYPGIVPAMKRAAGWVSVTGVLGALVVGMVAVADFGGGEPLILEATWFSVGGLDVPLSLQLDGLQAVMVIVVSGVSLLVHLFSVGYMKGDRDVIVYFAELSLFSGAMLLLVLASNFFLLYVAWELVGATSYLLISYYFYRPEAAAAGKKAFLTTRLGDLGLLLAIFAIWSLVGSLDFDTVFRWAQEPGFAGAWAVAVPLLIFAGAAGKSAQFPLHVWLPDAMEGPTPVSALIHAATMVAAGVYLVARTFPIFAAAPDALTVVSWIGGITALGAAFVAVTQRDIKKVLAYSTISQLGYMTAALGAAAPTAGIFHLFTHAWFKALLFLGAGSVIHAAGVQVVDQLSGLGRRMPWTAWTFTIGALALAGIPPFAGFFSKEEVLGAVAAEQPFVFVLLLLASFLTAFYIFRLVFLVFFGPGVAAPTAAPPEAAPSDPVSEVGHGHALGAPDPHGAVHESGPVMLVPLVALAVGSAVAGFFGASFLGQPLQGFLDLEQGAEHGVSVWITALAVILGLAGVVLAWMVYGRRSAEGAEASERSAEAGESPRTRHEVPSAPAVAAGRLPGFDGRLQGSLGGLYGYVAAGYRLDDLYRLIVVRPLVASARFLAKNVEGFIDAVVDGIGSASAGIGGRLRGLQSGEVRDYLAAMALAAVVLMVVVLGTW